MTSESNNGVVQYTCVVQYTPLPILIGHPMVLSNMQHSCTTIILPPITKIANYKNSMEFFAKNIKTLKNQPKSVISFTWQFKLHAINTYNPSCQISNCYIYNKYDHEYTPSVTYTLIINVITAIYSFLYLPSITISQPILK